MKNKFLFISFAIACMSLLDGCKDPKDIYLTETEPTVALLQKDAAKRNSFTITFTPGNAVAYEYVCTQEDNREGFVGGSIEGIVKVDNADPADIEFTGKAPQTTYTIYARAFDAQGRRGPVASIMVQTMPDFADSDDLKAETAYTTNSSAGFRITGPLNFYKFEYALGTATDKQAFEDGTLEGIRERAESADYVANYFDLTPETDYVFYYRAYNRANVPTDVFEIAVTTKADGEGPEVAFEVVDIDVYVGNFAFTANSHCARYVISLSSVGGTFDVGLDDEFVSSGDTERVFQALLSTGSAYQATGTARQLLPIYTPPMDDPMGVLANYYPPVLEAGIDFYAYVGMYDSDGKYAGAVRYEYSTPEYDETLAPAEVTAVATNITSSGATLEFTLSSNTLGFFFDTIDADAYDQAVATGKWTSYNPDGTTTLVDFHENFLRDMFFSRPDSGQGYFWRYYKNPTSFIDNTMEPGQRFYIAICPMNANGASDPDWGELWISPSYTSATE